MKKKSNSHTRTNMIFVVGLVILANVCELLGVFERWELAIGDMALNLRGTKSPATGVVIVAIDQSSLETTGYEWPWPRDYTAKVIKAIAAGKPAVIAVDILFLEPSPNEEADRILAAALQEANYTVLAATVSRDQSIPGVVVSRIELPLQVLYESAEAVGMVNIPVDSDGITRSLPEGFVVNGKVYRSLVVQTAAIYAQQLPDSSYFDFSHLEEGNFAINFRGPANTFYTVPAAAVASGEIGPQTFTGKIVLLGVTDERVTDYVPVPFGGFRHSMSGVEIQANAIDTLIVGDYITRIGIGGELVGLPLPSPEQKRFGVYVPDLLGIYVPKLFETQRIFTLVLVTLACLMGLAIGHIYRHPIALYLAMGSSLGYILLWGIALLIFRVQVSVVAPEIVMVLGWAFSTLRQFFVSKKTSSL